jgi:molybdopterin/thiamine biosynthesis adenylyltransferase
MTIDHVRHGRQIRLPEIGEAGQERLASSEVTLGGVGDAREVEAAYLRAAGVDLREKGKPPTSADARAHAALLATLGMTDRAARDVADGALRALVAMRAILGIRGDAG